MGCDIHVFIEQRHMSTRGDWFPLAQGSPEFSIWRSYQLFTKLSGMRSSGREDVKPIAEGRGLPDGIHRETVAGIKDYHSPSWISEAEFKANFTAEDNEDWWYLGMYALAAGNGMYEIRFIFAYDS